MPGQMPPQGSQGQASPQGAQSAPAQGGPEGQQGGAGSISTLLMSVDKAIDHLNMIIGQSKGTSPQDKQLIGQVDQLYGKLMESLNGSGEQDDQDDQGSGAQGQAVPQEAGGNAGAVPSY